jgi:benzoyl-CoA reductase/2-hydroxyglutaryl-CoA dehydratase subunit BcrC/BadD/HgdB
MTTIAYTSPYIPPEWIAAHGLVPLRLQPEGPAPRGPIPQTAGICPYMRAFVNQAVGEPQVAGVILTTVCDQMRRGCERIDTRSTPAFCFNVPATWQSAASLQLYGDELERLGRFLVDLGGARPSDETLSSMMLDFEAKRPVATTTAGDGNAIPIAITGGPRTKLDESLLDLIVESGGKLVLDATETGALSTPPPFDSGQVRSNPRQALAMAYHGKLPGISRRPNDAIHGWLAAQVAASGAAGVVLLRYLWCDLWHAEVPRIRDALSVPLLDIDLDGEDPTPRNRTRIQAFLEGLS